MLGLFLSLCVSNASAQLSATELDRIFASDAAQGDGYGLDLRIDKFKNDTLPTGIDH